MIYFIQAGKNVPIKNSWGNSSGSRAELEIAKENGIEVVYEVS